MEIYLSVLKRKVSTDPINNNISIDYGRLEDIVGIDDHHSDENELHGDNEELGNRTACSTLIDIVIHNLP